MATKNTTTEQALAPIRKEVDLVTQLAGSLSVKTDAQEAEAVSLLSRIKGARRSLKAKKDAITKPLNTSLREIRGLFAPAETRCDEAERVIKEKLLDYHDAKERKRLKAEAAISRKLETGRIKPETAIAQMTDLAPTEGPIHGSAGGSVSIRTVRDVVVADEMLLPREYLVPDLVKIRQDALSGIEIPGVEIVERSQIAAR